VLTFYFEKIDLDRGTIEFVPAMNITINEKLLGETKLPDNVKQEAFATDVSSPLQGSLLRQPSSRRASFTVSGCGNMRSRSDALVNFTFTLTLQLIVDLLLLICRSRIYLWIIISVNFSRRRAKGRTSKATATTTREQAKAQHHCRAKHLQQSPCECTTTPLYLYVSLSIACLSYTSYPAAKQSCRC
jgi:hypothetical protein